MLPTQNVASEGGRKGTDYVVASIRCLVADLVQEYKGGHPGTAMGAAAIGVAMWRDIMRYNPKNPLWFGRDRYVLSVGHACLHQYIMLHLCGYERFSMDMLRRYHSPDFIESLATGHPEIEQEAGIELTTGLLGQGIANAVGFAIANKHIQARFSKPGFEELFNNRVYCMVGDGCLQEGIGQEAISTAGHLALDNFTVIYDQNKITVDGHIDTAFTEDVGKRFEAARWNVLQVPLPSIGSDQEEYVRLISKTIKQASTHKGQPTLVIIPTVIGEGSINQGLHPTHGAALGPDDVASVKKLYGFDPDRKFHVSEEVYDYFDHVPKRGQEQETQWNELFIKYAEKFPEEAQELQRRMLGKLPEGWKDMLPTKEQLPKEPQPTRKSSGIAIQAWAPKLQEFMVGAADLMSGTFVDWKGQVEFQNPKFGHGDFSGRQIRYGIREHCMAAIANGLSAYFPHLSKSAGSGIVPVIATYYIFFTYAIGALRMGALQSLKTITVATHDSLGVGEDGPTHQAIGLSNFFRSLPNCRLYRPADVEEVLGTWLDAVGDCRGPALICLTRQPVAHLPGSDRLKVAKGAYIVDEVADGAVPQLTLVATGSEVGLAVEAAKILRAAPHNITTRVVSMPCMVLFDKQSQEYRRSVIPVDQSLIVAVEAWSSFGWAKYAHASCTMSTFGLSGPYAKLFEHFGFTKEKVSEVTADFVKRHSPGGQMQLPGVGQFDELLAEHQQGVFHIGLH